VNLGLDGRVYLVTGGTSGLGRATAEALVAEGAQVVVSSRKQHRVNEAVAALGLNAAGVVADNADPGAPEILAKAALERFGRIDGALISVGGPPPGRATTIGDEVWRSSFESIFLGALRLTRHLAPLLSTHGDRTDGGAIAFVLSSSAKTPLAGLSVSNGLRPGLAMLAKDLADELGKQDTRVFSILPGRIITERTQLLDSSNVRGFGHREGAISLGRSGQPEEFGRMAAVLLSPTASYITGSAIAIDGGLLRAF
jgi:3-oxoacyl-[acyl-carrier protein] reductase